MTGLALEICDNVLVCSSWNSRLPVYGSPVCTLDAALRLLTLFGVQAVVPINFGHISPGLRALHVESSGLYKHTVTISQSRTAGRLALSVT